MEEVKPRYEFRVWAETLAPVRQKLERLAHAKRTVSSETYLISAATDRCNAKIRADFVDIKVLIAEDRKLQQWRPVLKSKFPLASTVITTRVFPSLELPAPVLTRSQYDLKEFLNQVVQSQPRIAIVRVSKTRYQFDLGRCQAEIAFVTLNDLARETVAVESTDPDAVLQLIRDLGIGTEVNTSYVRELKCALSLASA